jgi:hypothetical protein
VQLTGLSRMADPAGGTDPAVSAGEPDDPPDEAGLPLVAWRHRL